MEIERGPTIYEKMAQEKMSLAMAHVRVLNCYDPKNTFSRMEQVYNATHRAIIMEQSEASLDQMDKLISRFSEQIGRYRQSFPDRKQSSENLREKLRDPEAL